MAAYIIPFRERPVRIGQGFNSKKGSHRDWPEDSEDMTYSVDFLLSEGTEIIASREGTVVFVKDDGTKNYSGKDSAKGDDAYKNRMNHIEVKHGDGTYASYSHLQHKSSIVKIGQKVKQGQVIAKSGNTGWSTEPHLDFNVYRKNYKGRKIKTIIFRFSDYKQSLQDKK
jgi:murein DD-endopeptidase MepM/ murein hydrolase activator NlpD